MLDLSTKNALDELPFSAVLCDREGKILEANRSVRRLLPGIRKGCSASKYGFFFPPETIRLLTLPRCRAFLFAEEVKTAEGISLLYAFIEDLMVLGEKMQKDLLKKGEFVFRKLDRAMEQFFERADETRQKALKKAFQEVKRVQRSRSAYLRFLDLEKNPPSEKAVSASNMMEKIALFLQKEGIDLQTGAQVAAAVKQTPQVFSALVLNLVLFVEIFERETKIAYSMKKSGGKLFLRFEFKDRARLFDACGEMLSENIAGASLFLPLLCVFLLCRREKIGFYSERTKTGGAMVFSFDLLHKLPELYLSALGDEETRFLSDWIQALFSDWKEKQ